MKDCRLEVKLNLKICEGCGALWLRAADHEAGVYCRGCTLRLSDFPAARGLRRGQKRTTVVRTLVCAGGAK